MSKKMRDKKAKLSMIIGGVLNATKKCIVGVATVRLLMSLCCRNKPLSLLISVCSTDTFRFHLLPVCTAVCTETKFTTFTSF